MCSTKSTEVKRSGANSKFGWVPVYGDGQIDNSCRYTSRKNFPVTFNVMVNTLPCYILLWSPLLPKIP